MLELSRMQIDNLTLETKFIYLPTKTRLYTEMFLLTLNAKHVFGSLLGGPWQWPPYRALNYIPSSLKIPPFHPNISLRYNTASVDRTRLNILHSTSPLTTYPERVARCTNSESPVAVFCSSCDHPGGCGTSHTRTPRITALCTQLLFNWSSATVTLDLSRMLEMDHLT